MERVRYGGVDVADVASGQWKHKVDLLKYGSLTSRLGWEGNSMGGWECQIRKPGFISFHKSSRLILPPKASRAAATSSTATACARSSSAAPASGTAATSHLWATRTNGRPPPPLPTRTPTDVPPTPPPGSRHSPRYEAATMNSPVEAAVGNPSTLGQQCKELWLHSETTL